MGLAERAVNVVACPARRSRRLLLGFSSNTAVEYSLAFVPQRMHRSAVSCCVLLLAAYQVL